MPDDPLSPQLAHIDALIEAGDFEAARAALAGGGTPEPRVELLRIKLGLADGSLPAELGVQRLTQLMRKDPHLEGAKELYQRAANDAYAQRRSNMAHSHPPPADKPRSK
jgi:hypothetical protein